MAAWDVVVIGGGAAGLSAAATAASAGLSCLVLDRMGGGGELMNLGKLEEVDGAPTGPDMVAQLLKAAMTTGAELAVAEVTGLVVDATGWQITTDDGAHAARAVILAVGLAPGRLGIAGEDTFEGRGLSYCAACDGPLYRGQPMLVAGTDRWAIAEAHELSTIASHVTLVTQGGMPPATAAGFAVLPGRITALQGESGLKSVLVQPEDGGAEQRLHGPVLFVQTGRRPALDFAPTTLIRDPDGKLVTDATGQCHPPGLFAAGDARAGTSRTIAAAIADGNRAAIAAQGMFSPLGKPTGSE